MGLSAFAFARGSSPMASISRGGAYLQAGTEQAPNTYAPCLGGLPWAGKACFKHRSADEEQHPRHAPDAWRCYVQTDEKEHRLDDTARSTQ
eukprot:933732-Pelagomonas_calceolata.AAC.1